MKKNVLAVAVLLSLTACTEKSEQMKELAQMSLRQSLGGGQLKIMGISEPDSTFGTNYMRSDEKKAIIAKAEDEVEGIREEYIMGLRSDEEPLRL